VRAEQVYECNMFKVMSGLASKEEILEKRLFSRISKILNKIKEMTISLQCPLGKIIYWFNVHYLWSMNLLFVLENLIRF
jgi:hypothetical protein